GTGGEPAADAQEGDRAGGSAGDAEPATRGRYAEPKDSRDVKPHAILGRPGSICLLQVDSIGHVVLELGASVRRQNIDDGVVGSDAEARAAGDVRVGERAEHAAARQDRSQRNEGQKTGTPEEHLSSSHGILLERSWIARNLLSDQQSVNDN